MDEKLLIVFLTASREYAFDVQPFHPFDYLIKPFEPEALERVLREARRVLGTAEPELTVRAERTEYRLPYNMIVAVLSRGHAIEIRTVSGQVLCAAATFAEVEKQLSADPRFLPCNRGILLNMEHVSSASCKAFYMIDGTEYPIRVRATRDMLARFSQFQISHIRGRMG